MQYSLILSMKFVSSLCVSAKYCIVVKLNEVWKKLHRRQVNLHKQGAMLLRMKEEMWNWTSTHRDITTGGCILHLKAVKMRREQDENTSEDNSAVQHGDSRMHSTVTKKHHLDRVKTSEVTIAMCPFVCVCECFSLSMSRYSAATSFPHPCIGIINSLWFTTPGPAWTHCVFIMFWLINKTRERHGAGLMVNFLWLTAISRIRQYIHILCEAISIKNANSFFFQLSSDSK